MEKQKKPEEKPKKRVKDLTPVEKRKWRQKIYSRFSSNKSRACLSSK